MSIVGNTNTTRFCDPFETHCNIDPITKDIVVFDDNITDVNANAKLDPLDLRYIDVVFGDTALNYDCAANGIYDAAELDESAVPGILDDAPAMISDFWITKASFELSVAPARLLRRSLSSGKSPRHPPLE